jgi:hypothetical protein
LKLKIEITICVYIGANLGLFAIAGSYIFFSLKSILFPTNIIGTGGFLYDNSLNHLKLKL